jgi:very-short-patch-repair endonuclease
LSETHNYNIQHGKNGGEKKIGNFYVDGFCKEKKLIFEFNGEFFFYHYKSKKSIIIMYFFLKDVCGMDVIYVLKREHLIR